MTIHQYIDTINKRFKSGVSTEHSYRGDLQTLLQSYFPELDTTNEPRRQKCGAPDYIVQKNNIPIGYIEAKDIGMDLIQVEKTEQLSRYLESLDNLILTDYFEFRLYRFGKLVAETRIARFNSDRYVSCPENYSTLENILAEFVSFKSQTIKSSEVLAKMMAQKARLMENILYRAIIEEDEDDSLRQQYESFKKVLIHDLDERTFADIYAQTTAYGLFVARLNDTSLDTFSREEAMFLIPKTNPFLVQLFNYIAGPNLDDRVVWIVNELADIFCATDLSLLLADFGSKTHQTDPFIHFYETFLREYDPEEKMQLGVFYTPKPIVNFIVRTLDQILVTHFKLVNGLADDSKVKIDYEIQGSKIKGEEIYKVQILDPATGTGTFLTEVIEIVHQKFLNQKGLWNDFVNTALIPRLNGFEILMASYAMCHIKMELLLKETGFIPTKKQRFRVFLTNSLEEADQDAGNLFGATWLSDEAKKASIIKNDYPVMVVLGNPPYSNFGQSNSGAWIRQLISDYKEGLGEKKINLDDDYIKFIRLAEHYIEKNKTGIVGMITNNSYLDGVSHRRMRQHLLSTFNEIYILNLHGDVKKKERTPTGSVDQNVFDIQQGVSICIMIRHRPRSTKSGTVHYFDLFGRREEKYHFLFHTNHMDIPFTHLTPKEPDYFFVPKDLSLQEEYNKGFALNSIFHHYSSGIQTKRDKLTISMSIEALEDIIEDFRTLDADTLRAKYDLPKDGRDWKVLLAKEDIMLNNPTIIKMQYRILDFRYTVFTGKSRGFLGYPRATVMRHFLTGEPNFGLIFNRKVGNEHFSHIATSQVPICHGTFYLGNVGQDYFAPAFLYDYPPSFEGKSARISNLKKEFIKQFVKGIKGDCIDSLKDDDDNIITEMIIDYIVGYLSCPNYQSRYNELLKMDFPRVPYPKKYSSFVDVSELGRKIRQSFETIDNAVIHTNFPISGNNVVKHFRFEGNQIFINDDQYFDGVSSLWIEFEIGGYKPVEKWIIDRKGKTLKYSEILYYQRLLSTVSTLIDIRAQLAKVIE
ncbi:type ISP restriction/modification enzyme [Marispirochaeta aestuarii]|uniref:type ISP restriction/modification enzyme n=1 Tax=Marispirochaeta aestuarii TaxID=1963862 RepID=UPI002ABE55D3|nr:type ISP restriction/modification enzyme [Marispirochaeta aestuarii]